MDHQRRIAHNNRFWLLGVIPFLMLLLTILACSRTSAPPSAPWSVSSNSLPTPDIPPTAVVYQPVVRSPDDPIYTPTPDPPRLLPTPRLEPETYSVQQGDTLGRIADHFHIGLDSLIAANDLSNINLLEVGQVITIPPPVLSAPGQDFKIIPDSELVYGPVAADFDQARDAGSVPMGNLVH